MKLLTICGSLRENSNNNKLLNISCKYFPENATWTNFQINQLPFFDPQLQFNNIPEIVMKLRLLVKDCDYILIATPEYAHGIPGVLKNALEWIICEESLKKRTILLIASPSGGEFVLEYLSETIRTMDLINTSDMNLIIRNTHTVDEIEIKNFIHNVLKLI